ncbi:hypothetical protein CEXT_230141 [Caerostris extrusa]|uniref:Uncharacterized protein n=1 Tax=Caerostris extrusa TaxID=172846 RepID=A0AAV4N857_CAEEX|nr:hypothetical protein CEXT_230141 [Caerostris extrusa]
MRFVLPFYNSPPPHLLTYMSKWRVHCSKSPTGGGGLGGERMIGIRNIDHMILFEPHPIRIWCIQIGVKRINPEIFDIQEIWNKSNEEKPSKKYLEQE